MTLPNRVLQDNQSSDGRHFLTWEFKPGQRMQLRVPVERWTDRIVLPIDAVATDGGESYVFQANGDHFDRRPVHVEYRDQVWAVIANDGSLYPGRRGGQDRRTSTADGLEEQGGRRHRSSRRPQPLISIRAD